MSMMQTRIFGMRFHSNESLQPGTGEIAAFPVTRTFAAIHDHVRDMNLQIETLTAQAEAARERAGVQGGDVFGRIERVLVALITKFPAGEALQPGPEGPQSALTREKRGEMLGQVLGQLRSTRPAVRTT